MLNPTINVMTHISFLLCIGMFVMVTRKYQHSQVRSAFLATLGVLTIWNVGTLLELDFRIATGVTHMLFVNICYIGICLTPIGVLYLGKAILQPDWIPTRVQDAFLIIPFVSIVMVFTDPLHHLFFKNFSLYSSDAVYGTYYYFHSLYSYGCIVAGIILMFIASNRNSGLFSRQSILVILGVVTTLVPNILYSFGIAHLPFSVSAAAFTLTILCFSIAFLKYRFIAALPISLRQVVDLISDGYLVVDKQLYIISYNRALLRMFPDMTDIALGGNLRTFVERYFLDTSHDMIVELHARAAARRETFSLETYVLGGAHINVEITPVTQRNEQTGSIILFKDITQSKLLITATQAASQAKSDFLSHVSHEIRTPLNAIIGMINIGINTNDIDKMKHCFLRADSASKHLLGIINDVLDMSKIEADKFELSQGEFNFENMLINITNVANVRAEEKQLNFVVNLGDDVPVYIESDELRLSQVITNLLTNAIKFTPEKGTVLLRIKKTDEAGDEASLRIEVADTGIGISKEQQKRLFSAFSQANADISQKFGGTGLGLAISERIVKLMGGNIWVESELGSGAKFIFTIKVKKLAGEPCAKLSSGIRTEDLRILAVDDSAETREYFTHVMQTLNLSCDVAAGGLEALDMIKNAGDMPYNIFFVDWLMPDMNGIELTKIIRKVNGEDSIVIMISVADWNIIEEEAIAAGVKHFISKPLFPSTLINAINICIDTELNGLIEDKKSTANRRYNFNNHTLLIAEDIEINREIMSAILEETNVSIDYAENGEIAVSMFSKNPDRYSLILMDINMPEMNGYDATRAIRALNFEKAKGIPIIAMTANVFKEDVGKCLASGMNDHTGKPINTDVLFGLLNKHLHIKNEDINSATTSAAEEE